jgi:hypothetical protein
MPDLGAVFPGLALAALVVVLVWFAFGTQMNVRRGNRMMGWLQEGLPVLGPRATLRWMGSSVVALTILDPQPPFRSAEVLVILEPRDLGAIWALARRRGRRDLLLVRASMAHAPRFAADFADPRRWIPPGASAQDDDPQLVLRPPDGSAPCSYEVRDDGSAPLEALRSSWEALAASSGGAWRLSVRRTVPHLEIHVLPPSDLARSGSARLFTGIRQLAELASQ